TCTRCSTPRGESSPCSWPPVWLWPARSSCESSFPRRCEAMALLFIIGTVLLGVSCVLLLKAVAAPRLRVAAQMRQIETYGFAEEGVPVRQESARPLAQLAERVGRATAVRAPLL